MKVREPAPGEILGNNYIIEQELGRGGFGVVYKARHADIERVVAIKVLLATYAAKDASARERFRREAMIAASLDYPNSLRIFDYGSNEEGVFYIVMEFVQGRDLGKVLRTEGRLPVPRAVHIIRQVLHALMEAHARGIVHRDIKPDNVMLCPLAYDQDFVKVMDFGIAKMVDGGESITQAGITLGTPRYMPIEQLKGERLGPPTDLYATGLVLYEMLVGRPHFVAETAVDTAVLVMQGGTVSVPEEADVAPEIKAIIEKACSRHAEDRYQSARAFLEALNALPSHLLDVDAADRERFAAEGRAAPATRPAPPVRSGPASAPPFSLSMKTIAQPEKDEEDAIKTQAVSTEEILHAKPPRGGLTTAAREAATTTVNVESVRAALLAQAAKAQAQSSATSMVPVSSQSTSAVPTQTTSEHRVQDAAAPTVTPSGNWLGAPPLLVVMNAAVLVLVLVLLLKAL
ncbi:MAG: serine/threonine protein kinase [Deltaproteobacteria bacterium]|nr:serine/threonine protein kinase [Deltaproteobacteria bacterium]